MKGYLNPVGFSIIKLISVTDQDRSTLHLSFSMPVNHFPSLPSSPYLSITPDLTIIISDVMLMHTWWVV